MAYYISFLKYFFTAFKLAQASISTTKVATKKLDLMLYLKLVGAEPPIGLYLAEFM